MTRLAPHVCISILNWNSPEHTLACLHQLGNQTYHNFIILVVDNASSDGSVSRIRDAYPHLELITARENLGYAGGHRLALERAFQIDADLLWLLNVDLTLREDTLSALVHAHQKLGVALYGSVPLKSYEPERIGGFTTWELDDAGRPDFSTPLAFLGKPYAECFGESKSPRPVASLDGSSMLVPLAVVEQHGFMSEAFFLYSEEVDYCLRLGRAGVPSYIVPRSIVLHEYAGSYKSQDRLKPIIKYYYERNRLIIMSRYMRRAHYIRQLGVEIWKCIKAFAKYLIRYRYAPKSLELRCRCMAVFDALFHRMGKRFSPEDYLD